MTIINTIKRGARWTWRKYAAWAPIYNGLMFIFLLTFVAAYLGHNK